MKIISLCMVYVMLAVSMAGCSSSQVQNDIANLESRIPQVAELATAVLEITNPALAPLVALFAATLKTDMDQLQSLIQQCSAAGCSASTLAGINAIVQTGVNNINNIVAVVGVKNPEYTAKVQGWASIVGLFFNDLAAFAASNAPKTALDKMPALFGWHIAGINMLAIDGSQLPPPTKAHAKMSGHTARSVAKQWNDFIKKTDPKAQISCPRAHVLGVPVPFTGRK